MKQLVSVQSTMHSSALVGKNLTQIIQGRKSQSIGARMKDVPQLKRKVKGDNAGFEGIGVDPTYLNLTNSVFINPDFLTGVGKIQDGKAHELTQTEKVAVECLRATPIIRVEPTEESAGERSNGGKLSRALKKRKSEAPAKYINCDFILATAVDVERLWSTAKNVLTDRRRGMATMMVQVILFLKENRDLWNCNTVYKSITNVQKKAAGERRRKREELLQEQENMQQAIEQANTIPVENILVDQQ